MAQNPWLASITKIIAKLSPKTDLAQFRNDCNDVIRSIKGDSNASLRDALSAACNWVEGWTVQESKCPCCAVREWTELSQKSSPSLPAELLVAFAKKLPMMKPGAADWQPFFFSCRHKTLLDAIVDRRFVNKALLQSWLSDRLQAAYPLPILDVAIENDAIPDYPALWGGCLRWGERPERLLNRYDIMATCYLHANSRVLDKELYAFLLENKSARKPFFQGVLSWPGLLFQFSELLAIPPLSDPSNGDELVDDFITTCQDCVRIDDKNAQQAALAIGAMRLHLAADLGSVSQNSSRGKACQDVIVKAAADALRQHAEDPRSTVATKLHVVSTRELYDLVHQHLKSLTSATGSGSAPADRSTKYERHLGMKEVIDQVVSALSDSSDFDSLQSALEVGLFNLGVRPLGKVGEETKFEGRRHQVQAPGIVPGDTVEVVEPGRSLGKGEESIVLVKAKVRKVSN